MAAKSALVQCPEQPASYSQTKMARAEISPIVAVWMLILGSSQPPGDQKSCSNDIVLHNFAKTLFSKF